jgi:hypothetical protein
MDFRNPGIIALAVVCAAVLFLPGHGLMGPAMWLGGPRVSRVVPLALVIFCVLYFGTLKFWELVTGDRLEKPLPAILALCAHADVVVSTQRLCG